MKCIPKFLKFRAPTTRGVVPRLIVINGEIRVLGNERRKPVFMGIPNGTKVIVVQERGFNRLWMKIQAARAMFGEYNGGEL